MHRDIPTLSVSVTRNKVLAKGKKAYKNVPPEKRSSIPVRHWVPDVSPAPDPVRCTNKKVAKAPTGAARLKTNRCALAARLDKPCLSNTDVSPKDAGALCTIIARKIMKLRPVSELDAPSAIPSAAAWMTRPVVVAKL